jgi:hypothetical protein
VSLFCCPLDGRLGCPPGGADACVAAYGRVCAALAACLGDERDGDGVPAPESSTESAIIE